MVHARTPFRGSKSPYKNPIEKKTPRNRRRRVDSIALLGGWEWWEHLLNGWRFECQRPDRWTEAQLTNWLPCVVPKIGRLWGGNDLYRGPQRQGPYTEKNNDQGCYHQCAKLFLVRREKREHGSRCRVQGRDLIRGSGGACRRGW